MTTTADLIRQLQELDPTGSAQVVQYCMGVDYDINAFKDESGTVWIDAGECK